MHAVTKHNTVNRNLSKVTFVFKLVRPAFFMQGVIWYVVVLISLLFRHSKWTQSLKFVNITQPHVTASLIFKLEYSSRYSFLCFGFFANWIKSWFFKTNCSRLWRYESFAMSIRTFIDILSRAKFKTVPPKYGFDLVSSNLLLNILIKFVCHAFPQLNK